MQNKSIFLVNLIANVSENVIFAEVLEICCNKFDFYKLFCFRMRFILLLCFVGLALTRPPRPTKASAAAPASNPEPLYADAVIDQNESVVSSGKVEWRDVYARGLTPSGRYYIL